jgi:hypothetical protein
MDFMVTFPDCERSVSIFEALCTVFSFSSSDRTFQNLSTCAKCGRVVEGLFRAYVELMELSKASAEICRLVRQAENWHKAEGKGDFNIVSVLEVEVKEEAPELDQDQDHWEAEADASCEYDVGDVKAAAEDSSAYFMNTGIKTVPKKRKINAVFEDEDENQITVNQRSNRRKSNKPVKISSNEELQAPSENEEEDENPEDEDFDPGDVEEGT